MMSSRPANADTRGGKEFDASALGAEKSRAAALAAEVEDAWAARALGVDRVIELGRYRLLRTIGRGGMGQVFEAWDPHLERHVAIKLVLRGGEQATLEEARCLARVAHPNVVCVHEVGRVGEFLYIAMELVDGPDLRKWLREGPSASEGPRHWTSILDVLIAAGRGLAAVHEAGLLHGDVKPGNVLIGRDGRVRVADFGLARADAHVDDSAASSKPELDELVRRALEAVDAELLDCEIDQDDPLARAEWLGWGSERIEDGLSIDGGQLALDELRSMLASNSARPLAPPCMHAGGTVPYMAPERRSGNVGGPAADQYSFCATAHEALFGVLPEPGSLAKPPNSRDLSAILEVLQRGLAVEPEQRWPSMDALCSALERARSQPARFAVRPKVMFASFMTIGLVTGSVAGLQFDQNEDPTVYCERTEQAVASRWGPHHRAALQLRFAKSPLPLPRSEARFVINRLDAWVETWSALWARSCGAQPVVSHCLAEEEERFNAVLALLDESSTKPESLGAARALVTELGSPTLCLDPNRGPSLGAEGMGRLAELSQIERRIELAVLAGAHDQAARELRSFDDSLEVLASAADPSELALHRLAIEPLRARVLVAAGKAGEARTRLRDAIREAEAHGHDELRFALLLERTRLAARLAAGTDERTGFGWIEPPLPPQDAALRESPTLDDLAALEGLAERVEAGPVERAELSLIRAGLVIAAGVGDGDHRKLAAELEAAGEELTTQQPEGFAELRLELALRRAQLHFAAGDLVAASRAAEQARAIGESSHERSGLRVWAALTLAGASAALLGDCDRVGPIVEDLWQLAEDSELEIAARQEELRGLTGAVDWASIYRACPYRGRDLELLVTSGELVASSSRG